MESGAGVDGYIPCSEERQEKCTLRRQLAGPDSRIGRVVL
jgi:hypothetical protein